MRKVERELDRILNQLRNRIRERGFTQLEVQEVLGWGRSYISQLLTKQKTLRMEQILMILNVINVKPEDFWAEIYQFGPFGGKGTARRRRGARRPVEAPSLTAGAADVGADLRRIELLYEGIVALLKQKNLITAPALADAIERARSGQVVLPVD